MRSHGPRHHRLQLNGMVLGEERSAVDDSNVKYSLQSIKVWILVASVFLVFIIQFLLTQVPTSMNKHKPEYHLRCLYHGPSLALGEYRYPGEVPHFRVSRADRKQWPREGFSFRMRTGLGFEIDTFRNIVTKDMGSKPDTTITLELLPNQLDEIYNYVMATRLYEISEPCPPYGSNRKNGYPGNVGVIEVEFRIGNQMKSFVWNSERMIGDSNASEWSRLLLVMEKMFISARTRPEFRALPKRSPVYLW